MHLDLLAIGFGLGLVALAASIALARPPESVDDGWVAAGLAVAAIGVVAAAGQVAGATIVLIGGAAASGAAIGRALARTRPAHLWAPAAYVAALVAVAVVYAALPDTEGPALLGAALAPVAVGALTRGTWWLGAAAGAGLGALAAAVGVVAFDAAAERIGALVVAAAGAAVCAALVVLVLRVVVDPSPLTSERGRPSR